MKKKGGGGICFSKFFVIYLQLQSCARVSGMAMPAIVGK